MHAFAAAGASFLLAVLWFDLMFDVQTRKQARGVLPANILASIAAYYRRVTTEARPMNLAISVVMSLTLISLIIRIVRDPSSWIEWVSLILALSAIGLALSRTVRNAKRLGRANDPPDVQTRLARSIYRDHQFCFVAMLLLTGLQLTF
jgi:hypothetical protein